MLFEPGTRTKYSNAGVTVVGAVVERVAGKPFPQAIEAALLKPLGMTRSSFEPGPDLVRQMAHGLMWTYDDQAIATPTFLLGTGPGRQPGFVGHRPGTVPELSVRAGARTVGRGHQARDPAIDDRASKRESRTRRAGFGLGFAISTLDGERRIGHNGAVYGFATDVQALPDAKLGVVVITTRRLRQWNCRPHRHDRAPDDAGGAQRPAVASTRSRRSRSRANGPRRIEGTYANGAPT